MMTRRACVFFYPRSEGRVPSSSLGGGTLPQYCIGGVCILSPKEASVTKMNKNVGHFGKRQWSRTQSFLRVHHPPSVAVLHEQFNAAQLLSHFHILQFMEVS
jgi:hypothetical protein